MCFCDHNRLRPNATQSTNQSSFENGKFAYESSPCIVCVRRLTAYSVISTTACHLFVFSSIFIRLRREKWSWETTHTENEKSKENWKTRVPAPFYRQLFVCKTQIRFFNKISHQKETKIKIQTHTQLPTLCSGFGSGSCSGIGVCIRFSWCDVPSDAKAYQITLIYLERLFIFDGAGTLYASRKPIRNQLVEWQMHGMWAGCRRWARDTNAIETVSLWNSLERLHVNECNIVFNLHIHYSLNHRHTHTHVCHNGNVYVVSSGCRLTQICKQHYGIWNLLDRIFYVWRGGDCLGCGIHFMHLILSSNTIANTRTSLRNK